MSIALPRPCPATRRASPTLRKAFTTRLHFFLCPNTPSSGSETIVPVPESVMKRHQNLYNPHSGAAIHSQSPFRSCPVFAVTRGSPIQHFNLTLTFHRTAPITQTRQEPAIPVSDSTTTVSAHRQDYLPSSTQPDAWKSALLRKAPGRPTRQKGPHSCKAESPESAALCITPIHARHQQGPSISPHNVTLQRSSGVSPCRRLSILLPSNTLQSINPHRLQALPGFLLENLCMHPQHEVVKRPSVRRGTRNDTRCRNVHSKCR